MKVKSTGLANANMDITIDEVRSHSDANGSCILVKMSVNKPRNWKVVAKIEKKDILIFILQVLKPSVFITALSMMFTQKE